MITIKKQELLANKIMCSWTIKMKDDSYFKKKINKEYNVISIVYFNKSTSYKDNKYYIFGLNNIITNFTRVLPSYRLRIYHDNTTVTIINDILKNYDSIITDNIELFEYDIPFFREDNNIYHKGVVGTLIRFLPLFNSMIHRVSKCIVFDADNTMGDYYNKLINYYDSNNIKFSYRSRFCYISKRISCLSDDIIKYPMIASYIYQSISLPHSIFSNFLEVLYIKDSDVNNNIMNLIHRCNIANKYEYGIDELFINRYLILYFYKERIPIAPVVFDYSSIYRGLILYVEYLSIYSDYIKFLKGLFKCFNISNIFNSIETNNIDPTTIIKKNRILIEKQINIFFKEKNSKAGRYMIDNMKKFLDYSKKKYQDPKFKLTLPKIDILIECISNDINISINKLNLLVITTDYINNKKIDKMVKWIEL